MRKTQIDVWAFRQGDMYGLTLLTENAAHWMHIHSSQYHTPGSLIWMSEGELQDLWDDMIEAKLEVLVEPGGKEPN